MESILNDEARQVRNAYMRQYRKRNPEKTREMNRRYWERRAAREKEEKANEVESNQVQNR